MQTGTGGKIKCYNSERHKNDNTGILVSGVIYSCNIFYKTLDLI